MTLSAADDLLIHQTPDTLRHVFTSDRRFYDRHFFTGHSNDGEMFFLLGMGVYPNLSVIDAFASFSINKEQITVRGSRELTHDRLDTSNVGPFSLEVIEGLKTLRFSCSSKDGIEFDLTWTGTVEAFEEPPTLVRSMSRVVDQVSRFVQTGRWQGHILIEGKRFEVNATSWWGSRDHSWGVRAIGLEPEPFGVQDAYAPHSKRSAFWIWSPMQFEDSAIHMNVREQSGGERSMSSVRKMPANGGTVQHLSDPQHDLVIDKTSKELISGSVNFIDIDGQRRRVELEPLRVVHLFAGTGYGGPDPWRHGKYMGTSWSDTVRFDLTDPTVVSSIRYLTHTLCRMKLDTGQTGYADFEFAVHKYPRYGFE